MYVNSIVVFKNRSIAISSFDCDYYELLGLLVFDKNHLIFRIYFVIW